jgi:hypothetical protein
MLAKVAINGLRFFFVHTLEGVVVRDTKAVAKTSTA